MKWIPLSILILPLAISSCVYQQCYRHLTATPAELWVVDRKGNRILPIQDTELKDNFIQSFCHAAQHFSLCPSTIQLNFSHYTSYELALTDKSGRIIRSKLISRTFHIDFISPQILGDNMKTHSLYIGDHLPDTLKSTILASPSL